MIQRKLLNNSFTLPVILFCFNFFLKLFYLTDQDICIDEPFTIYHAQFDIHDIVTFLKPTNNPPLYEIVLHYWIKLFGIEPFSVRFLPLLFSSLTVVFVFKLASLLQEKKTALIAALLFTFSTYHIYYSHDSRAYPLFLLLSVISFFLFAKILSGTYRIKYKLAFVIINTFLVYTHYFGFIVWFIQVIYLFVASRKQIMLFFILYVGSMLFFIPQFMILFQRAGISVTTGTWIEKGITIESLYNKLVVFSNMPVTAILCLVILLCLGIILILNKERREKKQPVSAILLCSIWFFVPLLGMFVVSYKLPVFLDRYLIFCTPAYYLLLAGSLPIIFKVKKYENIFSVMLLMAFLLSLNLNPSKKREVSATVQYIKKIMDENTMLIICAHEFINNFTYYYDKKIFTGVVAGNEYRKMTNELNHENIFPVMKIKDIPESEMHKFNRIIFLDASADFSNPGNEIYSTLKKNYVEIKKTHFNHIFNVYEWKKNQLN